MHILETNDLVVFNNITCQIHKNSDLNEMCRSFLDQVRLLLDFDAAVFYFSDFKNLPRLSHAVCCGYSGTLAAEYLESGQDQDYSRGLMMGGKKMVATLIVVALIAIVLVALLYFAVSSNPILS